MAKMEGMKVVIAALIGALPSIANVMAVCIIFWLIFAIIGVNFFMGQFQECVDGETYERFHVDVVPNKSVCLNMTGGIWVNPRYTVTTRASNKDSQRFHNHRGGPYPRATISEARRLP